MSSQLSFTWNAFFMNFWITIKKECIPTLPYHHTAKPYLQCFLFVSILVADAVQVIWMLADPNICVPIWQHSVPSFPALYHWRLMLILYWYFRNLAATLRGRERWFAEAESLWQMGCLFSAPDITQNLGKKRQITYVYDGWRWFAPLSQSLHHTALL